MDVSLVIPESTREFLARTIASTGGNEVYFLGRIEWETTSEARIVEVDVFARGNQVATPAIIEGAETWDVAIHNHPGGDLTPSEADLAVAAELGNREVGFAIIDNEACHSYLVVSPFRNSSDERVDPEEVLRIFSPEGPLAEAFTGGQSSEGDYELRQAQVDMALSVAESLNDQKVVALEAGTGVGKSFAYLVPAILWAVRNKKRIVVSTNTINLQEQLVGKDLPLLEQTLPFAFTYTLIKGRNNYACLRKAGEAGVETTSLFDNEESVSALRDLLEWVEKTDDGSLADLSSSPRDDVWEKVMSETDKSLKVKCDFYDRCFYYRAKRQANKATIVVVNHHLFFSDLAVRRETQNYQWNVILPGYDRVIFDEAHHLEDVASKHLGVRVAQQGLRLRFARLASPKERSKGVLPFLARKVHAEGDTASTDTIENHLIPTVTEVSNRIDTCFDAIVHVAKGEFAADSGGRDPDDPVPGAPPISSFHVRYDDDGPERSRFRRTVRTQIEKIEKELRILGNVNDSAIRTIKSSSRLETNRKESLLLELTSLGGRLEKLVSGLEFFRDDGDEHARWLELRRDRRSRAWRATCVTSPIRVGAELKKSLFEPLKTVVMTSATLSVDGSVDFLGDRIGFAAIDRDRFEFAEHSSPFDYERQACTLLPTDFPDPGARGYDAKVGEIVLEVLRVLGGRTFVLFTSYSMLNRVHQRIEKPATAQGVRVLRQGEASRSELLRRFRSGPRHLLLATDSFWEGVDVKGSALECVVITRLPFRVPTEPLQVARVEELKRRGLAPFPDFAVPQAVLKLKQGYGRLIRSTTDRGVVLVLDRRLVTQAYGKVFLRSLPPARLVTGSTGEIVKELEECFDSWKNGGQ